MHGMHSINASLALLCIMTANVTSTEPIRGLSLAQLS